MRLKTDDLRLQPMQKQISPPAFVFALILENLDALCSLIGLGFACLATGMRACEGSQKYMGS